jgi:hypothetical protein
MKITKERLKQIILEELNETSWQGVKARERLGLQMDSYIEEAGGGGFKAPTPEDTVLGKIIDAIKKLKGKDDGGEELSADEKKAKLKQQIRDKAYADKILSRYKAKKGL